MNKSQFDRHRNYPLKKERRSSFDPRLVSVWQRSSTVLSSSVMPERCHVSVYILKSHSLCLHLCTACVCVAACMFLPSPEFIDPSHLSSFSALLPLQCQGF